MEANNNGCDNDCDKVGYITWRRIIAWERIMVAHLEKAEGGWGRLEPEKVVGFQCGSNMVQIWFPIWFNTEWF